MPDITQIQVGTTTYTIADEIANNNINSITTSLYSLTTSLSTMAFQSDAPSDGEEYIRKNGIWTKIPDVFADIEFYVSSSGADTNPGTSTAPFATIQKAINSIPVNGCGWINLLFGNGSSEDITIGNTFYQQSKTVKLIISRDATLGDITCYKGCSLIIGTVVSTASYTVTCKNINASGGIIDLGSNNIIATGSSSQYAAIITTNGGTFRCSGNVKYQGYSSSRFIESEYGSRIYVNNVIIDSGYSIPVGLHADYGGVIIYGQLSGVATRWRVTENSGIITNGSSSGGGTWGSITGTLSDQTDLQSALSTKADIADLGNLAGKDTVDYTTDITNTPTLGTLASKDAVDYTTDVTNKPTLGTMAAVNDATSNGTLYGRKNGAWSAVTSYSPHVEYGGTGSLTLNATSYTTKTVTFTKNFANTNYLIMLTMNCNDTASAFGQVSYSFHSKAVNGFSIKIYNGSSAKRDGFNIQWMAIQL